MPSTLETLVWRDNTHEGPQWIGEIIETRDGEERTAFSTTWYRTQAEAQRAVDRVLFQRQLDAAKP